MLQALLAGVASIKAQQSRMNVIGNNLANVNTSAFKSSRVTFQDMLSQTVRGAGRPDPGTGRGGTNPIQFGLGVVVAGTDVNGEQGSLSSTNRPTDLAIQGTGFFLTSDGTRTAFTRDGGFDLDAEGYVVHRATGERVLGWDFIAQGNTSTSNQPGVGSVLNVPLGRLNTAQASSRASLAGNLSGYQPQRPGNVWSDPLAVPPVTADWTTQVRLYDAQGGSQLVTVEFYRRDTGTDVWDYRVLDPAGVSIGSSGAGGGGTAGAQLTFDAAGQQTAASLGAVRTVTVAGVSIELDFDKITQLKTGTQAEPLSQVTVDSQDGFPPGALQSFAISSDGVITGQFTNGLAQSLGQIAMAVFANPGGLEKLGNNLWRQSENSGAPAIGTPRTGGRGSVNSGFLEQSNVDIGNEFTDLIVTQRGFQANTRVVTTVDEMLQDLLNMKR